MIDEAEDKPLFKELDNGTVFEAAQFWESDVDGMRHGLGTWAWEDISGVEQIAEQQWPEMQPRCAVKWQGGYLYLLVDYRIVQRAWRKYRLSYGSKHLRWTTSS